MTPAELRASRLALSLSQQEAAEAIGISLRQWQYLEAGRDSHGKPLPDVPKLYELAWAEAARIGLRWALMTRRARRSR